MEKKIVEKAKSLLDAYKKADKVEVVDSIINLLEEIVQADDDQNARREKQDFVERVVCTAYHTYEDFSGGTFDTPIETEKGLATAFYEDDGNECIMVEVARDENKNVISLESLDADSAYQIALAIDNYDYKSFDNYFAEK